MSCRGHRETEYSDENNTVRRYRAVSNKEMSGFTTPCYSNGAVLPSYDVRLSEWHTGMCRLACTLSYAICIVIVKRINSRKIKSWTQKTRCCDNWKKSRPYRTVCHVLSYFLRWNRTLTLQACVTATPTKCSGGDSFGILLALNRLILTKILRDSWAAGPRPRPLFTPHYMARYLAKVSLLKPLLDNKNQIVLRCTNL